MYKSKIKEQFRKHTFEDKEYMVLFDIGDEKVMIYDDGKNLLYDLYKNKLESPQPKIDVSTFLKMYNLQLIAKRKSYELEYNLYGIYKITDAFVVQSRNPDNLNSITNLRVQAISPLDDSDTRLVFPSRFKVLSLRKGDEVIGGSLYE